MNEEDNLVDPKEIEEKLNILPITSHKKQGTLDFAWDVKKFSEERIKKENFKFVLNLEEEKQEMKKYEEILLELNRRKQLYNFTPVRISHGYEKVFNPLLCGIYYTIGHTLESAKNEQVFEPAERNLNIEEIEDENYFQPLEGHRLYSMDCNQVFKLMTLVPDEHSATFCYKQLIMNNFHVPFTDILMTFMNWGMELSWPNINIPRTQETNISSKLHYHNIKYVLKYIQHFHKVWQEQEIVALVLVLITAALDEMSQSYLSSYQSVLYSLLNTLKEAEICQIASHLIKDFTSWSILNAIFVCVDVLPVCDRGNLLATITSFGLLKNILITVNVSVNDCVCSVLDALLSLEEKDDPNGYFQLLYYVIKLVENIAIKRNNINYKQRGNVINFTTLRTSATFLQSSLLYSHLLHHMPNLYLVKEMLERLINHCYKLDNKYLSGRW